jgi:hypothetical protein
LLAKETFIVFSVSAIIRSPKFIVRACFTWTINSFTLWLMKIFKINCDNYTNGISFLRITNTSIDNKLLRNTEWLNNDICNINGFIWDFLCWPSFTFVPWIKNFTSSLSSRRHYNESTMITNFINVRSFHHFNPSDTAISWEISIQLFRL